MAPSSPVSSPVSSQAPSQGGGGIKRGRASLVGGIAVGVAVLALWIALARDLTIDTPAIIVCGALVAIAVAAWIRIADL